MDFLLEIYNNNWVRAIGTLIIGNVVLGLAIAIMKEEYAFYLGEIANFMQTKVIPYLLGWGVAKIVAMAALSQYAGAASTAEAIISGAVILALVGKLMAQFKIIFPDLPVPAFLTTKTKPETQATP